MTIELYFTICIILVLCITINIKYSEGLISKFSNISGNTYKIHEELPDFEQTADVLGKLELFIDKLLTYLYTNKKSDPRTKRLIKRLNDISIEEAPFEPNVSSYTINKGELISLCIRNKKNKQFHNYQTLLFVVIHELAHVASVTKGHNKEFIDNFKWLLKIAKQANIYMPQNYSINPIEYCGVKVTNNPYF